MKKVSLVLALALVLALSLTAFAGNYVDGTYEGYSDAGAKSFNYAKVYIEDGEIVAVTLREFTNKHVEKNFEVYSYELAREATQSLSTAFVENQGTEGVDIVTGATGSSKGYIQAVERALLKADPSYNPDQEYFDGTFLGRSHVSSRGYYEVVWVTLENDKVVDVKMERIQPDYSILDPAEYGWPLEAARDQYKAVAVESEPGYVDTISGATGATKMWNIAVRDALDKARIR